MQKANLFIVNGFLWRRANGRWVFPELNAKSFLFLCNFIFKGYTGLSGYTEGPFLQHCGSYRVGYWGLDLLRCDVFNGLVIFETTFSKCQRSRQFPSGVLNAPELAPWSPMSPWKPTKSFHINCSKVETFHASSCTDRPLVVYICCYSAINFTLFAFST